MLRSGCQPARPGVAKYELASRRRQARWLGELGAVEAGSADSACVRSLFEEILTGEILTRVWGAILTAHESAAPGEFSRTAERVLVAHVEAVNRALAILLESPRISLEQAARLNQLRRRCERWTDLLLGPLVVSHSVNRFAVDIRRAIDFADGGRAHALQQAWPLTHAALKAAFWNELAPASANPDLNRVIGQSVLACFSPELFDGTGQLHSLWTVRLLNAADDAQWLVEHLAEVDTVERPPLPVPPRSTPRFRA